MPKINLQLDNCGKLTGITERDQKAWAKFVHKSKNLGDGSISFSYALPRSGPFHRRFFAMVNAIFEGQDKFTDPDMFRVWLQVGAGYAKYIPNEHGELIALPKSIAYEKLDQVEFKEIADKVFEFARSPHARKFLWDHMSDSVSAQMIESILQEFEKER